MEQETPVVVQPVDKNKLKGIYKVLYILSGITAVEFLIAFTMPTNFLKVAIFIGLTIVKAFYIVAEFMHLGHERKSLILSIMLPIIFLFWLIGALLWQGTAVFNAINP